MEAGRGGAVRPGHDLPSSTPIAAKTNVLKYFSKNEQRRSHVNRIEEHDERLVTS